MGLMMACLFIMQHHVWAEGAASVTLRPTQLDISTETSESAVLVTLSGYSTNQVRYRLYSGSNQYNCWDATSETYISANTYSSGPLVIGDPTTSTTFWILFQRGSNNSTSASYRDRVSPYSANNNTIVLPEATSISNPITITKGNVNFASWTDFTQKYVILGYNASEGGTLISATSTAIGTGEFNLKINDGTIIQRIEVRSTNNTLVESVTGTWPASNSVISPSFLPNGGTFYAPISVSITTQTPGATIFYSLSSNEGPWNTFSDAINIEETTTVWAYAIASGLDDSNVSSATFTFPQIIEVENISALRAGSVDGTVYRLTGEAILTYKQTFRNKKWVQDDNAGIEIDDNAGKITTTYNIGDGISGLIGTLNRFNNMLQFTPVADPGNASSTGNIPLVIVKTLGQLVESDQSRLVLIENASFDGSYEGQNFSTGTNYNIVDASGTGVFRTEFFDADYIGQSIPSGSLNITAIVRENNGSMQITARNLSDIEEGQQNPDSPFIDLSVESLYHFGNVYVDHFSNVQFYYVNAENLTSNITITAPTGYKVSESFNDGFSNSLTLAHTSGSITNIRIFVRFYPTSASSYVGNISHSSTGALTKVVAVQAQGIAKDLGTYYSSITATGGEALYTQLHKAINSHTSLSYSSIWSHFYSTDPKYNGKVWDIYSDRQDQEPPYEYTFGDDQQGADPVPDQEGHVYNREHSFPVSWWGGSTTDTMYTDIHHIYPADRWVNMQRSNWPYGIVNSPSWTSLNGGKLGNNAFESGYTNTAFEPVDEYKGDLARTYFYMATRYMWTIDTWGENATILNGSKFPAFEPWVVNLLLNWHENDPVSQKEIDRNNAIYSIQGNRNPFIDNPQWALEIWGTTTPQEYLVTFTVNDGENPIVGAIVSVEGFGALPETNASGQTSISLQDGDYDYTVTAQGYSQSSGNFSVNSQAVNITVTLTVQQGQITFVYWNFNQDVPANNTNWAQPIPSTLGNGQLSFTFTQAYSFGGTTINGVTDEVNGGSFSPRGGVENENNGRFFTLSFSTLGYKDISLSYPTRRTTTGFTHQEILYTTNGIDWQTKQTVNISEFENNWVAGQLISVDFTGIEGIDNNPNFAIRIVLTGASAEAGNNRIDNIEVTATAIGGDASNNSNLSSFTLGDINVLGLSGIVVTNPDIETGATLEVDNFIDFSGIVATPEDENATVSIKVNGNIIADELLPEYQLSENDVVLATVVAENQINTKYYKVTLVSPPPATDATLSVFSLGGIDVLEIDNVIVDNPDDEGAELFVENFETFVGIEVETTDTNASVVITIDGVTINPDNYNTQTFSPGSVVLATVVAEDGVTSIYYKVTLTNVQIISATLSVDEITFFHNWTNDPIAIEITWNDATEMVALSYHNLNNGESGNIPGGTSEDVWEVVDNNGTTATLLIYPDNYAKGLKEGSVISDANIVLTAHFDVGQSSDISTTILIKTFLITFSIIDEEGNPVANADITMEPTTNGEVFNQETNTFEVAANYSYQYSVSAQGYHTYSGETATIQQDVEQEVILILVQPAVEVTFTINDGVNPIQGAIVTINGNIVLPSTNEMGQTIAELEYGNYSFRVAALGFENYIGSFTVSGETSTIYVTLTPEATQVLLVENFSYTVGSYLNTNGWTAHSGSGNSPIQVVEPSLQFPIYAGAGIGNAAAIVNNGEDVHRTFPQQTSGNVYAAFLVQTESTNNAGYFLHLGQAVIGTTFFTRVWVNATGNGIGLGSTEPTSYIPITPGVVKLVVIKYQVASKESSLFVFDEFPTMEPETPHATFIETGNILNAGSIALRQYNANQRVIVDGIRIATTWEHAVKGDGIDLVPPIVTFNPEDGATNVSLTIAPTISFSEPIQNTDQSEITNANLAGLISFTEGVNPIGFTATINTEKTLITITPNESLEKGKTYNLTFQPVADEAGNSTSVQTVSFTTIQPGNDATLETFALGGENVLDLYGIIVTNPTTDPGATLFVDDFSTFSGIQLVPADDNASATLKINGVTIAPEAYQNQSFASGDVVVATVVAENGVTTKYYKVTLTNILIVSATLDTDEISFFDNWPNEPIAIEITWNDASQMEALAYINHDTGEGGLLPGGSSDDVWEVINDNGTTATLMIYVDNSAKSLKEGTFITDANITLTAHFDVGDPSGIEVIVLLKTFNITINVNDNNGNSIPNPTVTVSPVGDGLIIGQNGNTFEVSASYAYNISVSKAGYISYFGSSGVIVTDTTIEVILFEDTQEEEVILTYWNFNQNVPETNANWAQPIPSFIGSGTLTFNFTQAYSFGGTTFNGIEDEENGGSFAPRGGVGSENNGAYLTLSFSTQGYRDIILNYPTRRTSTGFTHQQILYTINGNDWISKETFDITSYANNWLESQMVTSSFIGIDGVDDNPNFAIRIVLTGASAESGNNRLDNIKVMATQYSPQTNANLSIFTLGGVDALTLNGVVVNNPVIDPGASLVVEDFSTFIGIVATPTSSSATVTVTANGVVVNPSNLINYNFSANDVVVATVVAGNGVNTRYYKVTTVPPPASNDATLTVFNIGSNNALELQDVIVPNPIADGAILWIENFETLVGLTISTTHAGATASVSLNGNVINPSSFATLTYEPNDVILVTVIAEDGATIIYYKVTLTDQLIISATLDTNEVIKYSNWDNEPIAITITWNDASSVLAMQFWNPTGQSWIDIPGGTSEDVWQVVNNNGTTATLMIYFDNAKANDLVSKEGYVPTGEVIENRVVFDVGQPDYFETIVVLKTFNLTINVLDAAGEPISGATITVQPNTPGQGSIVGQTGNVFEVTANYVYKYTVNVPGFQEIVGTTNGIVISDQQISVFVSSSGEATLAKWDFENEVKRTAVTEGGNNISLYTPDQGSGSISITGASFTGWVTGAPSTGFAANSNTWDEGVNNKYWSVNLSTIGYENITLTSKQKGSNTGPKNFSLQYSLNNSNWVTVVDNIVIANDNFVSGVVNQFVLPSACENQSNLYLRWVVTSTVSVNDGTVASGGTNRIDDIIITGSFNDVVAPIASFNPANGATDVFVTTKPVITFNEPIFLVGGGSVTNDNVASLITFKDNANVNVPFTATVNYQKKIININPSSNLGFDKQYTIAVAPVQDLAGNQSQSQSATFSTISATTPYLMLTSSHSGTFYAGDQLTVTWESNNIQNVAVEIWNPSTASWSVVNPNAGSVNASLGSYTFNLASTLPFGLDYKLRVRNSSGTSPVSQSGIFKVRAVALDLITLRSYDTNDEFRYDGQAVVTYTRTTRNQKYIQDNSGAIVIDDVSGIIASPYQAGNVITGLVGKLSVYFNMLQLVPLENPGPATSSAAIVPFDATLASLTSNDQAKLVRIPGTYFISTGTFVANTNYEIDDPSEGTGVFRTSFSEADYIGQPIPTETMVALLTLVNDYNGTIQLASRQTSDFVYASSDANLSIFTLGGLNVLHLGGIVVNNPTTDPGAILYVDDFTGFAGIAIEENHPQASSVVTLNGSVVNPANYSNQPFADGDVVVVTVTAEDGTIKYYKVNISEDNRELELTYPVGGETFYAGADLTFEWVSNNVANINLWYIDLSNNSAIPVNTSPIPASLGSFTASIPNGIAGLFNVRVSDAYDNEFFDETTTGVTIIDAIAPSIISTYPAHNAQNASISFTLRIEFDERVVAGSGALSIRKMSDDVEVASATPVQFTIENNMVSFNIQGLNFQTEYYVAANEGLFLDPSGNSSPAITKSGTVQWHFVTVSEPTNDLFFSEYIEGSSNNKAFEIFNPTGIPIDLSQYSVKQSVNGNGWGSLSTGPDTRYVLPLSGILQPDEVIVIANAQAGPDILAVADVVLTYNGDANGCDGCNVTAFNGNDALGLFKNDVLIDQIGNPQSNVDFDVAGITGAGKDRTLVRKNNVTNGNTNWELSAGTNADDSEWFVYPIDTYDYLGWHLMGLNNSAEFITFSVDLQMDAEVINSETATVYLEVLNGTDLTTLVPSFTLSEGATAFIGSEEQVSGQSVVNFTTPVTYTIVAENGNEKLWVVTIAEAAVSSQAEILGFTVPGQTSPSEINSTEATVNVLVAPGTDITNLIPTISISLGATISPASGVPQDFSQPVTYTVTAQNGTTTKGWTVTVTMPEVISIFDIRNTTNPDGESPYQGQTVGTMGVVTSKYFYQNSEKGFFIQDGSGPWRGITVYTNSATGNPTVGDLVYVSGKVDHFFGHVQLTNNPIVTVISSGNDLPNPIEVTTQGAQSYQWQSSLIKVLNATCTDDSPGSNRAIVNDGSGALSIDPMLYAFSLTQGLRYNIIGLGVYVWSAHRLAPRGSDDIVLITNVPTNISDAISVYPNPFNSHIWFDNANSITSVSIFNALGQAVETIQPSGEDRFSVNTHSLMKGLYFIVITDKNGERTVRKLIKN